MIPREQIISGISDNKLILIMRRVPEERLLPLAAALYSAGVRYAEVTFVQCGDPLDTCRAISRLRENFGGGADPMHLGAGTVMNTAQLGEALAAGASFMISPNTSRQVIEATREAGAVSIPGALTPTEIAAAHEYGADYVKLFPSDAFGLGYIKAVRAPMPHIRLLAVGGVTADSIPGFLGCGISGFGVSSGIIDKALLARGDYEGIAAAARRYFDAIKG